MPFPSPGDLPDLGIEPGSPTLQEVALPSEPPGTPKRYIIYGKMTFCFWRVVTQSWPHLRPTDGEGNSTPLQYSCLENPMDGGAWRAAVHGVTESRVRLGDFTFPFHFHALEKAMATHSSILAWRIPGTEEPGGLPSMGSHRVGHD